MEKKIRTPKILVVIPSRGGSKGVLRKNIRNLNGQPLISYAIRAILNSKNNLDVIVSTDDEEVANIAVDFGVNVPFLRPKEISGSNSTLILVSKHALEFFDDKGKHYDAILSLQPTSPFITSETIDKAIQLFIEKSCTSVITVSEISDGHPYTAKKITDEGGIVNFCDIPKGAITFPRQLREPAYSPNGAIYLRNRELISSYLSLIHISEPTRPY